VGVCDNGVVTRGGGDEGVMRMLEGGTEAMADTFNHIDATMYLQYHTTNPPSPEAICHLPATICRLIYVSDTVIRRAAHSIHFKF
jgi:hypothetical protein